MKAKKSLGQNFFINKNLGDYIINTLKDTECDSVIEIGPGMGFFTEKLSTVFKNITVIEKDTELARTLQFQFPDIKVLNEDFLNLDLDSLLNTEVSFFGSLPFNVSKPIIRKIIEDKHFTKKSFFIVQKEVAEKYIYKQPYSSLSLTTHIYADCKKIIDISPDSFRPKPNVTSSLISFTPNRKVDNKDIPILEDLINRSFKQPRKNIFNNLRGSQFEKGLNTFKTLRPAQLSLDEFIQIYKYSL